MTRTFRPAFTLMLTVHLASMLALGQVAPVTAVASPATSASGQPELFVDSRGNVYLSWIEVVGEKRHALRFSVRQRNGWTRPRTIAEGGDWQVNWANFPSLIALDDRTMMTHWFVKTAPDPHASDIKFSVSTSGGLTWSEPRMLHNDRTPTEHGFVSMAEVGKGQIGVVWLDGRNMKPAGHNSHGPSPDAMTLRFATVNRNGEMSQETVIDPRVCECCQTSAAMTSKGMVVVYRDRSDKEVRDISIARFVGGKWTDPASVHSDGWEIEGCPVNGPSVAAAGSRVAVAWFTAAGDAPRVKLAFSTDAGATFAAPVRVDDGSPLGRVETLLLDDGSAFVVWLERTSAGAEIRARRIFSNGERDSSLTVVQSSAARSSGFPRIARSGRDIYFAWTESATPSRVRTAVMTLKDQKR
jgi:hypothetical protein